MHAVEAGRAVDGQLMKQKQVVVVVVVAVGLARSRGRRAPACAAPWKTV